MAFRVEDVFEAAFDSLDRQGYFSELEAKIEELRREDMQLDTRTERVARRPAFPVDSKYEIGNQGLGISVLQYFAGQALAGILANPKMSDSSYEMTAQAAFKAAIALCTEYANHVSFPEET